MAENNNTSPVQGQEPNAQGNAGAVTFTQAQVDAMISTRRNRERAKYPSEDEMKAYNAWKAGQAGNEAQIATLTAERDRTQSELEALKRSNYVMGKGLTGDQAEFVAFKALKMVDDKTTFEAAVDSLTKDLQRTSFDWSAPAGSGNNNSGNNTNAVMNGLIRGAFSK